VKHPEHFQKFKSNNADTRFEKLKVFYHANMMFRLQESKLISALKVEKATTKVKLTKGDSKGVGRVVDLNELLRLKLENDRFMEKIGSLNKALLEVRWASSQEEQNAKYRDVKSSANPISPSTHEQSNFKKKANVQHVNSLTGKSDPGLAEKIREYELWNKYLNDSKNDLSKMNKLLRDHSSLA